MKTVVSLQDLVDLDIHPGGLTEEFQALTRSAVAELTASGPLMDVDCPGCRGAVSSKAFERFGLDYRLCAECATLFASPRPSAAALAGYARESVAATFWRDRILGETQAARREKLIRPRAEWVSEALAEHRASAVAGVDLSPLGPPFLEELASLAPGLTDLTTMAPAEISRVPAGSLDVVTAFDVIDRAPDVPALVAGIHDALRPGGLFLLTAPTITGFDLQVLWERSNTILPPDKLNLLSVRGFTRLFAAPAWQVIEFSTPGMFDVEHVRRAMLAAPGADWPRGVQEIVLQASESARLEFQEYLQRHRLSSFARLVLRRT